MERNGKEKRMAGKKDRREAKEKVPGVQAQACTIHCHRWAKLLLC